MSKKLNAIIFCMFFFIVAQLITAKSVMPDWTGSVRIKLTGPERYQAFFLPEKVYEISKPDLSDLRLTDQQGAAIPYFIVNGFNIAEQYKTEYHSSLIKTFTKKENTFFDFRIRPLRQNLDVTGDQLQFELPDNNFLRELQVYGGYDGTAWEYVTTGQLYRVDDLIKDRIYLNSIEKYTYYRIIIQKNIENLSFKNLVLIQENFRADWTRFQKNTQLTYQIKDQPRETVITIQNPQHLKIKRFLIAADGNFRREYRVYVGSEMNSTIATGEIYNLQFQDLNISQTSINISSNPYVASVIQIKIMNDDNRPLKIGGIQTEYYLDQVIFENTTTPVIRLYFGNPKADKPIYDLQSYREHVLKEHIGTATLDDFQVNQPKETLETPPYLTIIFNIVIAVIAVLLIVFLLIKLNSQKA